MLHGGRPPVVVGKESLRPTADGVRIERRYRSGLLCVDRVQPSAAWLDPADVADSEPQALRIRIATVGAATTSHDVEALAHGAVVQNT
jgi:hypothetical protein